MNIKKIFQKKQTQLKYSFNVDKVRDVALEGKQKINEKAEKWIEDNWIEQNILEAAALGKYSYTFNKVPKELAEYVGSYFDVGNVVYCGYPQHWIKILGSRINARAIETLCC